MTRRSYSCGRASWPPTWSDSGISHSVAEPPAALVAAVELLAVRAVRRRDQQHRPARPAASVLEVRRRGLVGEHRDAADFTAGHREAEGPLAEGGIVVVHVLRGRPRPGALGHHRRERVGLGCRLDHHLAADGEADAADAVRVDVRPPLQVRDGGLDVRVAAPAPGVRLALALAFAAAVEEQHAVAVAGEHPRLLLRAVAAGERDHRRAVARGDVPAGARGRRGREATSSCGTPSRSGGTTARPTCVVT